MPIESTKLSPPIVRSTSRVNTKFARTHVKLNTGEWINKEDWEKLVRSDTEQGTRYTQIAKSQGIEAVRQKASEDEAEFRAEHTELGDGQWITNESWEEIKRLDSEQGTNYSGIAKSSGLEAAQNKMNEDQKTFEASHIEVSNGQWLANEDWERIVAHDQEYGTDYAQIAKSQGIEAMNKVMDGDEQKFYADHTEIANNEWITNEDWQKIRDMDRKYDTGFSGIAKSQGLDAMQSAIASKYQEISSALETYRAKVDPSKYDYVIIISPNENESKVITKLEEKAGALKNEYSYDIVRAYLDGVITDNDLSFVGVTQPNIDKIKDFAASNIPLDTGEWISKAEFNKLSPENQNIVMKQGTNAQLITQKEATTYHQPKGLAQSIWWGLTPWKEEAGETVSSYGVAKAVGVMTGKIGGVIAGSIALGIIFPPALIAVGAGLTGYNIYETASGWKDMSNAERGFMVGLDTIGAALLISPIKGAYRTFAPAKSTQAAIDAAKNVRVAQMELKTAMDSMSAELDSGTGVALVTDAGKATKFAKAIQNAKSADKQLVDTLGGVKNITPGQLRTIENLTGYKGLAGTIRNLSKQQNQLASEWAKLDKIEPGTRIFPKSAYVKKLTKIQRLSNTRDKTLIKLNNIVGDSYGKVRPVTITGRTLSNAKNNLEATGIRIKDIIKEERGRVKLVRQKAFTIDPKTGKTKIITVTKEVKVAAPVKTTTKVKPQVQWDLPILSEKTAITPKIDELVQNLSQEAKKANFRKSIPVTKASTNLQNGVAVVIGNQVINAISAQVGIASLSKTQMSKISLSVKPLSASIAKASFEQTVESQPSTSTLTKIQDQTKALVDASAQIANSIAPDIKLASSIQPQYKAATKSALKLAIETTVKDVVDKVTSKSGVSKPVILPSKEEPEEPRPEVPQGSITWKQGAFWKYIPPPWTQEKPITLKQPPKGAITSGRTPAQTIQMIGKPEAKVPESASIDLGVVDIFITEHGKKIEFGGGGLKTSVGKRLKGTTKGMSILASTRKRKREQSTIPSGFVI